MGWSFLFVQVILWWGNNLGGLWKGMVLIEQFVYFATFTPNGFAMSGLKWLVLMMRKATRNGKINTESVYVNFANEFH